MPHTSEECFLTNSLVYFHRMNHANFRNVPDSNEIAFLYSLTIPYKVKYNYSIGY